MQIRLGHIFGVYHELIIGEFEHNRVAEYIAYYLSRKGHRIVSGFLAVPAVKVAEIVYVSKKQSALCALVGYLFAYLGNSVPAAGRVPYGALYFSAIRSALIPFCSVISSILPTIFSTKPNSSAMLE